MFARPGLSPLLLAQAYSFPFYHPHLKCSVAILHIGPVYLRKHNLMPHRAERPISSYSLRYKPDAPIYIYTPWRLLVPELFLHTYAMVTRRLYIRTGSWVCGRLVCYVWCGNARYGVSGIGYLVSGIWYQVLGIGYLVLGIGYLVSGIWYLVSGIGYLVYDSRRLEAWAPNTRYQIPVSGIGYLVSGIWYLVPLSMIVGSHTPDTQYQIPDTRYQIPDTPRSYMKHSINTECGYVLMFTSAYIAPMWTPELIWN